MSGVHLTVGRMLPSAPPSLPPHGTSPFGVDLANHASIVALSAVESGGFGACGIGFTGSWMRVFIICHTSNEGSLGALACTCAWETSGIGAPNFGGSE